MAYGHTWLYLLAEDNKKARNKKLFGNLIFEKSAKKLISCNFIKRKSTRNLKNMRQSVTFAEKLYKFEANIRHQKHVLELKKKLNKYCRVKAKIDKNENQFLSLDSFGHRRWKGIGIGRQRIENRSFCN